MTKIVDSAFEKTGLPCFICDYSPPRSGVLNNGSPPNIDAHFLSIAHSPGQSVRASSSMVASKIKSLINQDVIFTIATRDKNHMALQSELLGAQLLGLENVIVVRGDPPKHEISTVSDRTGDLPTTQVISGISNMNRGRDYRDIALDVPSDFCIGATIDLGRRFTSECNLVIRKIESGAHFFITQPVFDITKALNLLENIQGKIITKNQIPIFFGLQILEPDSISFSKVPITLLDQLQKGKSHLELAVEQYETFRKAGLNNVYLVPPIKKGGTRNYQAAIEVLATLKSVML